MSIESGSRPRPAYRKASRFSTRSGLEFDSDSDSSSYHRTRESSLKSRSSTVGSGSVSSSSWDVDSFQSSSWPSYFAEADDTSEIASKSATKIAESKNNSERQQASIHRQSHLRKPSISVCKVIDEAIASIEESNRELRMRVRVAEESTRLLQEQNLDLQRKISQVSHQYDPGKSPIHSRGHQSGYIHNAPTSQPSTAKHDPLSSNLKTPELITKTKAENENYAPRSNLLHRRHESQPSIPGTMSTLFRETVSHPLSHNPVDFKQQQSSQQFGGISAPISFTRAPPGSSVANTGLFDYYCQSQALHSNISERSRRGSNTDSYKPNFQPPHYKQAEPKDSPKESPSNSDKGIITARSTKITTDFSSSSTPGLLRPTFSQAPCEISSPLHGTIEHHNVSFEGRSLSMARRPNMISLEEARRRANSLPFILDFQEELVETGHIIEGEPKTLQQEEILRSSSEFEAVQVGKKKTRLQVNLLGLRRGPRENR